MTDNETTDSRSLDRFNVNRRRLLQGMGAGGTGGLVMLAGCTGSTGNGGQNGSNGSNESSGSSGSSGSKSVQFLTEGVGASGSNIKDFFQKNNSKFEKQTGITVDFTSVTWDNAQSTLVTRVKGNKAPDISRLPSRWIPQFVNLKAIDPIDDIMSGKFLDKFYPKVAKTTKLEGSYYGIPWAYSNKVFFYNKDAFKKAGLDPENPTLDSWNDARKAAQQVTENTNMPGYGLPVSSQDPSSTIAQFLPMLWSYGGSIIDDNRKPVINSKEAVKALTFYNDLVNKYHVTQTSPLSSTRHDVRKEFEQGNVGMTIGHVYVGIDIKNNKTGTNYGIVQVPKGPKGRYSLATTDDIVIYSQSKNKDASKKLINYYYDPKRRFQYCKQKGFLPVMKKVGQQDYFKNSDLWSPFLEASKYARTRPKLVNLNKVTDRIVQALQETVAGRQSPQDALDAAQSDIKGMIKDVGQ